MNRRSASYQRAHKHVKKVRGPASSHLCECGKPARDWALNHSGEVTLDENGHWFSDRADDYDPLCVRCHRRRDLSDQPGYRDALTSPRSSTGATLKNKYAEDPEYAEMVQARNRATGRLVAERVRTDPDIAEKYCKLGHSVGVLSRTRRRKCGDCGRILSPGSLGLHQKASGHSGFMEEPEIEIEEA